MHLRGLATFGVGRRWQKLVTLACLLAFVFVAAAHAGHSLAGLNDPAVVANATVPASGGDDAESAANDNACTFCALIAAQFPSIPVISADAPHVFVETSDKTLAARPPEAEFPPPIA